VAIRPRSDDNSGNGTKSKDDPTRSVLQGGIAVGRILSVVLILLASGFAFPGLAAAAQPAAPRPVTTAECSPVSSSGDQLCSTGSGTVRLVATPGAAPFQRLELTLVRELRQAGKVVFRSEEQRQELDLTKANSFTRTAAALVAGDRTCTFDESTVLTGNTVRRQVSNLVCAPTPTGSPTAAAVPSEARAPAPAAAALPTYTDYSATNKAPNGLATPIRYGTTGQGTGCTVTTTANPQTAVNGAAAGAVICVAAGSYPTTTLTVNKAVTVRASGVVTLKNIVITGSNAVVDGFNVVGGTLGNPNYAIKFSGTGHKITNNLVRGRGITYGIGCEQSAGCGTNVLISGNTITGVHNFGVYLWGGDRITVEKNNVFDLFQSKDVDDVDVMRAWGTNHIVRNNYFHDINAKKSAGSPHSDCFQAYQAGSGARSSSNILIENNYCVRVTGQCVIVQNDLRNADELKAYVIRGNVCETYGWQSIEITRVPDVTMDNNYVAGVQTTVLNFANGGGGNQKSINYKVRNNVLVRATAGTRYFDSNPSPYNTDNTANRTLVDQTIKTSYDGFISPATQSYRPVKDTDFNRFYRDSVGRATPAVLNAGSPPNSTGLATDVDGAPRTAGQIDVGPFELG
jgi:parallel beta-helix repeat protein